MELIEPTLCKYNELNREIEVCLLFTKQAGESKDSPAAVALCG